MEARGVEPLSKNPSANLSPGADNYSGKAISLVKKSTVILDNSVASLCMARSKLCVLTVSANRRLSPDRGTSGGDGYCLRSGKNSIIVVL